jgi:hypothetical protein
MMGNIAAFAPVLQDGCWFLGMIIQRLTVPGCKFACTNPLLDGTRNNERAWSAQIRIDKENLPVVIRQKDENT